MMGTTLRAFAHPTDFLQRLGVFWGVMGVGTLCW